MSIKLPKKTAGNPPKWHEVFPQGTREGDEEQKVFIALGRHPKYDWRSVEAVSKESGLPPDRVEEVISKYYGLGMIYQHPKNSDQWGYWERVQDLLEEAKASIAKSDQDDRIKAASPKAQVAVSPATANGPATATP